jgi:hypothetical protein
MSHAEQIDFFRTVIETFPEKFQGEVIDIGSLDINGGPHLLFKAARYVGVDLESGPNVNHVIPSQEIGLDSSQFDVVMSSECLEHNAFYRETLAQMSRLAKPGGLVVWSCAGLGRLEHGTSRSNTVVDAPFVVATGNEYYQNVTAKMAKRSINHSGWFLTYKFFYNEESRDTYFVGLKRGIGEDSADQTAVRGLFNRLQSDYKMHFWRIRYLCYAIGIDRIFFSAIAGLTFLKRNYVRKLRSRNSIILRIVGR